MTNLEIMHILFIIPWHKKLRNLYEFQKMIFKDACANSICVSCKHSLC